MTPEANRFLDELKSWLLARNDPRVLLRPDGSVTINKLFSASADYCLFRAELAELAEKMEKQTPKPQ